MFASRLGLLRMSAATMLGSVLTLPSTLRAQVPDDVDGDDTEWARVEAAVRTDVAQRWDVDLDQVVLEWGPHQGVGEIRAEQPPELVGSGTHGEWVVRLQSARGTVGVRVRAGSTRSIAVAATALRRGHVLGAADIRYDVKTVWGVPETDAPTIDDPNTDKPESGAELVGWVTKRGVQAGDPLVAPAISPPSVVQSGETVDVSWSAGAIRLTLTGRAMGTARAGESVPVRLETGKRVHGIAVADGTVRVSQLRP